MSDAAFVLRDHDHSKHNVHPDFASQMASRIKAAAPVLEQLAENGWTNIVFDPLVDCESARTTDPGSFDVTATVEAGVVGPLRVQARIVMGRPAAVSDVHMVLGMSGSLDAVVALVISDGLEPGAGDGGYTRLPLAFRSLADVGLTAPTRQP